MVKAYQGPSAPPMPRRNKILPLLILVLVMVCLPPLGLADIPGSPYRIAVVDVFFAEEGSAPGQGALIAADAQDIDSDGLRDPVFHGDLVSFFVSGNGIETVPFPVRVEGAAKPQLIEQLQRIVARDSLQGDLDAVVFCWESSTLISAVAGDLDPARRSEYREVVRRWGETDESWQQTHQIICLLQQLAARGLVVATIAGNSGPAWVNTYTFADGVMVVGAAEEDPDGEWATSNALIDTVAQSRYPVRLVSLQDRPSFGYDITGDGVADIDLQRGSSHFRRFGIPRASRCVLAGTSFAAPTALRQLLTGER
jgi:hypothetical protein